MKFNDITSRLTGISIPIFGISWTPPASERDAAKRVVTFLEDRRVLYNPSELEVPEHCVMSIVDMRRHLTDDLQKIDADGELAKQLRAMRAACRKFLDTVQVPNEYYDIVEHGFTRGHFASWVFLSALGELRGVFGLHLAQIAAAYGLDVEDDLASILPAQDHERDDDDDHGSRSRRRRHS
ncbi:MAG TPA: DUF6650 family protein [Thermoanaerobaculia bacterium]|nr:DUF6650 family protein [Thermoanaerobaculia bacterium]